MSFQIAENNEKPKQNNQRALKQAREQLDLARERGRFKWQDIMWLGKEMFGKTKGFSLGECKKLREEIIRRRSLT